MHSHAPPFPLRQPPQPLLPWYTSRMYVSSTYSSYRVSGILPRGCPAPPPLVPLPQPLQPLCSLGTLVVGTSAVCTIPGSLETASRKPLSFCLLFLRHPSAWPICWRYTSGRHVSSTYRESVQGALLWTIAPPHSPPLPPLPLSLPAVECRPGSAVVGTWLVCTAEGFRGSLSCLVCTAEEIWGCSLAHLAPPQCTPSSPSPCQLWNADQAHQW